MLSAFKQLWHRKRNRPSKLPRVLTAFDLILFGIGAIIGAGVFVLTGIAAATKAGPAIIVSYVIAGIAAMLSALAYAELASSIGGSGSAYDYAYTGFGEFIAWLIGWNLILEYVVAVATVAIAWSSYVSNFFQAFNCHLPLSITMSPYHGGILNVLAIGIVITIALVQSFGVKESARVNMMIVIIKLLTIAMFIAISIPHLNAKHWSPFMPFGWTGVFHGAALVFFAYIGFDALATAAEETIKPQRNLPIGIIVSLSVCSVLYVIVAACLTGIISYKALNVGSPVAYALLRLGYHGAAGLIAIGAIAGLTSVMFVMAYGASRIILSMAQDGLLPPAIAKINHETKTPLRAIITVATVVGLIAGVAPIEKVAELVNIGTLTAFAFVCAGVIMLRHRQPKLARPFKMPLSPVLPALGVVCCLYLMFSLSLHTWLRFIIWSAIGVVFYFAYGFRRK